MKKYLYKKIYENLVRNVQVCGIQTRSAPSLYFATSPTALQMVAIKSTGPPASQDTSQTSFLGEAEL